ncbi:MAG TPA: 4-hydroxythreonine-4-phosphate dehydrogenase PdxA, partial [Ilumatobacteraceae bacterium]
MRTETAMAITMGDASGVGPEIVLHRAADGAFDAERVVVYGDIAVLQHGAEILGLDVALEPISHPDQWRAGALQVVDAGLLSAADHRPGEIDLASGAAARAYVLAATTHALAGAVAGIVTMPMNKEATQLSDPAFVGHTELIAAACGVQRFTMMLTAGDLAVTHVSTHVSLQEAIHRVTTARVREVIDLTYETLHRFMDAPRIAVCGVNPHAGEHGLFGSEDEEQIVPAIAAARADGIDATGPHPADTVFHQAIH